MAIRSALSTFRRWHSVAPQVTRRTRESLKGRVAEEGGADGPVVALEDVDDGGERTHVENIRQDSDRQFTRRREASTHELAEPSPRYSDDQRPNCQRYKPDPVAHALEPAQSHGSRLAVFHRDPPSPDLPIDILSLLICRSEPSYVLRRLDFLDARSPVTILALAFSSNDWTSGFLAFWARVNEPKPSGPTYVGSAPASNMSLMTPMSP